MFVKLAALFVIGVFSSAAACVAAERIITIEDARAVATTPTFGAAFGTITANGKDKLISISSDCCKAVEIHQSGMLNGVISMRKIGSAAISEKKPIMLIPHAKATGPTSMHIMLIGATTPLVAGESVDITLHFDKAGDVKHRFPIEAIGAH